MNYVIFQQNKISGIRRPDWDAMYMYENVNSTDKAESICKELNTTYWEKSGLYQFEWVYGTEEELANFQKGYETIGGQEYEDPEYHVYIKNMTTGAVKECVGDDPRVQTSWNARKVAENVDSLNRQFAKQLATKNCQYIYHEPLLAIY